MFIQFLYCEHRFLPFGEVKAHKVNNQIQEVLDALELSGVSPNIKGKAVFFFESTMSVAGLGEGSGPHLIKELKGTGSQFNACSFIKMLFFCRDTLYRLWKQYDHVIMLSKNQSAHSPWQSLALDELKYRKIPKISPGAYIFQRPFLRGLFLEGLIYGGKFAFTNRLG